MPIDIAHYWKPFLEIVILWFVFYKIMLFFEGTRAVQVLRGIIVLIFAFFVFQILRLDTLDWLFTHLFGLSVIGILVIFQPEIRQGLARLGQQNVFKFSPNEKETERIADEIVKAVDAMCRSKTGALIAVEMEDSLKDYAESGVRIDSQVSSELIQTIFTPASLLHDGGLIIQYGRLSYAGCLFPLTDKQDLDRLFGTRHRAAIGLAEQTDAVIVTVSEENGDISFCRKGRLTRDMDLDSLREHLKKNLSGLKKENKTRK